MMGYVLCNLGTPLVYAAQKNFNMFFIYSLHPCDMMGSKTLNEKVHTWCQVSQLVLHLFK